MKMITLTALLAAVSLFAPAASAAPANETICPSAHVVCLMQSPPAYARDAARSRAADVTLASVDLAVWEALLDELLEKLDDASGFAVIAGISGADRGCGQRTTS